jgi:hypothetical protein
MAYRVTPVINSGGGAGYIKVTGGSSITIEDRAPSEYEIRYMDIVTGSATKSESINVTETVTESYEGRTTNYSQIRITLYTMVGGNTHILLIREEDFMSFARRLQLRRRVNDY